MESAYEVLRWTSLVLFSGLAVVAFAQWLGRHSEATAWLAATFFVLAFVIDSSALLPDDSDSTLVDFVQRIEIAFLTLFPYFLFRFAGALSPPPRWLGAIAAGFTAAIAVATFALGDLPQEGEPRSAAFQIYLVGFVVHWTGLSAIVAVRLHLAGRGQSALVRFRARTMAMGAALLASALILAAGAPDEGDADGVALFVQLLAILSAGLFMIGFAPPRWLKRSWIYADRDPFLLIRDLAAFAPSRPEIAERALQAGLDMLSSDAGFVMDSGRRVLASQGFEGDVEALVAQAPAESVAVVPVDYPHHRFAVLAPIPGEEGRGLFCALSGAFTPYFGAEEVGLLGDYAVVLGEALERVRITELWETLVKAIGELGEGFVVTDGGRLVAANDEYARMTGYDLDELRALPSLIELAPPEDRAGLAERLRERLAGGAVTDHYEGRLVRKDGDIVEVESSIKVSHVGDRPRLIALVRDITERKRIQQMRERFIADAAHELRTPIATLLGIAEVLEEPSAQHRRDQLIGAMRRSGDRTRNLIRNLLDLSRMQRGMELRLEATSVEVLIKNALDSVVPPDGVRVHHEIDPDLEITTDPERVGEAISNLLTNAYRYGGHRVSVKASAAPGGVTITVEDDGPGVEAALVPTMFEPFSRGESAAAAGGSGLGLAITRGIAEAAGGRIDYRPLLPRGSSFRIFLPEPAG
ncbi:MAG: PAS domain-containing sensor histidine kinase [Actinomycetota bacterium]